MKRFRERDPSRIAVIGVLILGTASVAAPNLNAVPFLGGEKYQAAFLESGGLVSGDDVLVSGLEVGTVEEVTLAGAGRDDGAGRPRVLVEFSLDEDVRLGRSTTAAIGTGTVLGRKFLELTPRGPGRWDPAEEIPLTNTTSPYLLTSTLGNLTKTVEDIDARRVSRALDVVSRTFEGAVPEMRATLDGLTRLSRSVSSRDEALRRLLERSRAVTGVLADRTEDLNRIVADGNVLFRELQRRRDVINEVLVSATEVSRQLSALVDDNRRQLEPALRRMNAVIRVLRDNADNITLALQRAAPFVGALGESVASGPSFFAYVQNLVAGNFVPTPTLNRELNRHLPEGGPRLSVTGRPSSQHADGRQGGRR